MSKPIVYHLHISNANQGRDRDEDYYVENLWLVMHHLTEYLSNTGRTYQPWHSLKYIKKEAEKRSVYFTITKVYTEGCKIHASEVDWDENLEEEEEEEEEEDETQGRCKRNFIN